jgi:hypothetical protein
MRMSRDIWHHTSRIELMGWQRPGSRSYFYQSRWSQGRSHNEYVGRSPVAELVAVELEKRRSDQGHARQELLAIRESFRPVDELMRQLDQGAARLIEAEPRSLGFYRSHRNWRGTRRARSLARKS